ncbi:hypothetical protein U2F26_19655 [Micromonospora sp. 4G57]|uniref:MFS transporter n=2 Tax=Micromonosporaceae TaxID=28056 RepID=A0ABU5J5Q0_9ACTN|nr:MULTISPECIES: hypothetical protein [unclassified Micromonospora]MDZ5444934.1 hypothetical protein [Micromonospora sp. 4G57]MDZ5487906.1 hypothetical protein [Micromonospora sp. 4G53]
MPLVVLVAAVSIFVVGVTLPEAFADRSHGLSGPLVFVVAFLLARLGPLLIATFALWNIGGRRRARGKTSRRRMLGVLLVALTAPATARLPGLGALVLLTAVGIGLATTTPFPATESRHGSR